MEPYFQDEWSTVYQGDCRVVLAELPDNSVDSIVTDPPYHLTTGKKGGTGEASVNLESPYGRARVTTGFMGMKWDGGDIAHDPEMWLKCLRVLKPGGYLLSFAGSRTYHRMGCAIEDAGFEIRDQIMWIYGSGFPKSHNLGDGRGTALKPAHEPICVARKPLEGTVAANTEKWGTGALNINICRIAGGKPGHGPRPDITGGDYRPGESSASKRYTESGSTNFAATPGPRGGDSQGRWPANVIHDGSEEVVSRFPETMSGGYPPEGGPRSRVNTYGKPTARGEQLFTSSEGNASRFFYCAKADRWDRNEGCEELDEKPLLWSSGTQSPGTFQAEGTKRSSKNNHPTVKPTDLMRYLCRLVTPVGGIVLDPFMGSGSTRKAALKENLRFIGIEIEEKYCKIATLRTPQSVLNFTQGDTPCSNPTPSQ